MKDKFKANFFIVLPAAILTIVIFFVITMGQSFEMTQELPYNILQIVPYILVLVGALIGINVFVVLIGGIVVSLIVGLATGTIAAAEMFTVVGNGVTGMYDITVISIVVACIVFSLAAISRFAPPTKTDIIKHESSCDPNVSPQNCPPSATQ